MVVQHKIYKILLPSSKYHLFGGAYVGIAVTRVYLGRRWPSRELCMT